MGLSPKPHLKTSCKKFSRLSRTSTQLDLCVCLYVVQLLNVAVCRAANSGCYEVNPANGIDTAVASLRYRIEMVGKLHLNRAERPMCRSVLGESIHMWALANIKGKEMRT